jgi:hypothetical protein
MKRRVRSAVSGASVLRSDDRQERSCFSRPSRAASAEHKMSGVCRKIRVPGNVVNIVPADIITPPPCGRGEL